MDDKIQTRIERAYRAACVLDETGDGDTSEVDKILHALSPLISPERRAEIEAEVSYVLNGDEDAGP